MPYNSLQSFAPLGGVFQRFPDVIVLRDYEGANTAALTATPSMTPVAVPAGANPFLVRAAQPCVTMTIVVPVDQPAVVVGNNNPLAGPIVAPPGQNYGPQQWCAPGAQTFTPPGAGFVVTPGSAVRLKPYNDPLYAVSTGATGSTIFFATT